MCKGVFSLLVTPLLPGLRAMPQPYTEKELGFTLDAIQSNIVFFLSHGTNWIAIPSLPVWCFIDITYRYVCIKNHRHT